MGLFVGLVRKGAVPMEIFFEDQGVGVVHKELTMYLSPEVAVSFVSYLSCPSTLYIWTPIITSNLFVLYLGV